MPENDNLVTADVIAELLAMPRKDVLKLAREALIPSIRFSRKLIRFDKARVRAAIDLLEIGPKRLR